LFSTTIRDNIAFGKPDSTDNEVERAASPRTPTGFISACRTATTRWSANAAHPVGGQRQRIALPERAGQPAGVLG